MTLRTYAAVPIALSLLVGAIASCTTDTASTPPPASSGTRGPSDDDETDSAFPDAPSYAESIEEDSTFQSLLVSEAVAKGYDIPLAIVDVKSGKYGANRPEEMHFTASAVKLAPMYAAYVLQEALQKFADDNKSTLTTQAKLFAAATTKINAKMTAFFAGKSPTLYAGAPLATLRNGEPDSSGSVHLARGFKFDGTTVTLDPSYEKNFELLWDPDRSNEGAGRAMYAVGYPFTAYAHFMGGFLDLSGTKPVGVWLTTAFGAPNPPVPQWGSYSVDCLNSSKRAANVATVLHLARFWRLLAVGGVLTGTTGLRHVASGMTSWVLDDPGITTHGAKVGVAGGIYSESAWGTVNGRDVVVVYQNLEAANDATFKTKIAGLRTLVTGLIPSLP